MFVSIIFVCFSYFLYLIHVYSQHKITKKKKKKKNVIIRKKNYIYIYISFSFKARLLTENRNCFSIYYASTIYF